MNDTVCLVFMLSAIAVMWYIDWRPDRWYFWLRIVMTALAIMDVFILVFRTYRG